MLTAKDIVEKILEEEGIPDETYEIVKTKGKQSKVKKQKNGSFKMLLNENTYDGTDPGSVMSALHEAGHIIANVKTEEEFLFLNKMQRFYFIIVFAILVPILLGNLYFHRNRIFYEVYGEITILDVLKEQLPFIVIFGTFCLFSMYVGKMKLKDEEKANEHANRYILNGYLEGLLKDEVHFDKFENFFDSCKKEMKKKDMQINTYYWAYKYGPLILFIAYLAIFFILPAPYFIYTMFQK